MVGKDFKIPRSKMDEFALASHTRASHASKSGLFKDEILPVETHRLDEAGKRVKVTVSHDDGIRHGTALTDLRKARSAFSQWGDLSTGGNSSQMTDGAAACLLMRRSKAEELGLPILARHLGTTVVGVTPKHMGTGPVPAIRKLLDIFKVAKEDIAVWEVSRPRIVRSVDVKSEADQRSVCDHVRLLRRGARLGPRQSQHQRRCHRAGPSAGRDGGSTGCACSGCPLTWLMLAGTVVTGLAELKRRQGQLMVTSMCIGSGMGAAALWLNEGQGRVAKL
jgi:acetyl-CoA acyltransferase 1